MAGAAIKTARLAFANTPETAPDLWCGMKQINFLDLYFSLLF